MKPPRLFILAVLAVAAAILTAWLWNKEAPLPVADAVPATVARAIAGAEKNPPPAREPGGNDAGTSAPGQPAADQSPPAAIAVSDATPAPSPVIRRRFAPAPAAARLPLVFALPPEEMTGLNERQAAAAIAIADQFYDTLGGDTADPSTTEYRDRWKREQPLADYQLRAAIGAQAYARYQEAAYLRAKAESAQ